MKFSIIHLDMIYGGAENLLLDIADSLTFFNHKVNFYSTNVQNQRYSNNNRILRIEILKFLPRKIARKF